VLYHRAGAYGRYKKGDDIREYYSRNRTLGFRGSRVFQSRRRLRRVVSY
jgi:hypothetical protein